MEVTKTVQDLDSIPLEKLAPGIPASAMPTKEFIEQVERIEKAKQKKEVPAIPIPPLPSLPASAPTVAPASIAAPETPIEPIVLEYKFSGQCSLCKQPVETLIIDTEKNWWAVAWCVQCKKKRMEQRVKPLQREEVTNGSHESQTRVSKPKTLRPVSSKEKISV